VGLDLYGLSTTLFLSRPWGATDLVDERPEACLRIAYLEEYLSGAEGTWGIAKEL